MNHINMMALEFVKFQMLVYRAASLTRKDKVTYEVIVKAVIVRQLRVEGGHEV